MPFSSKAKVLAVVGVLWASPCVAQTVSECHNSTASSSGSSISLSSCNVHSGDVILCGTDIFSTTATVSSISGGGGSWAQVSGSHDNNLSSVGSVETWGSVATTTNASTTITVNWSAANLLSSQCIIFSGTVTAVDIGTSTDGTAATSATSPNFTPAGANDAIILCLAPASAPSTYHAGTNYTFPTNADWDVNLDFTCEYRTSAPSGSQNGNITWTNSSDYALTLGSAKVAAAAACSPTLTLLGVGRCGD